MKADIGALAEVETSFKHRKKTGENKILKNYRHIKD
jgi:hypothetical protein